MNFDTILAPNSHPTSGGHPIVGSSFITVVTPNSVLAVINATGNATALTITPADGNLTHAASQTITVKRVG